MTSRAMGLSPASATSSACSSRWRSKMQGWSSAAVAAAACGPVTRTRPGSTAKSVSPKVTWRRPVRRLTSATSVSVNSSRQRRMRLASDLGGSASTLSLSVVVLTVAGPGVRRLQSTPATPAGPAPTG